MSDQIIQNILARLITTKPDKILLFGSRARMDYDTKSDYDLLVVCSFTGKRHTVMSSMMKLLEGLDIAIDVVVLTPEEFERDKYIPGTVARPAWLEGVILYDAA